MSAAAATPTPAPGPYEAEVTPSPFKQFGYAVAYLRSADGSVIAELNEGAFDYDPETNTYVGLAETVNLLAASPDLYAALSAAVWYVRRATEGHPEGCDCDPCRERRACETALMRAGGGAA